MKIAMACDHGGYDLKTDLMAWLTEQGHQVEDFGCPGRDSCDYADFAGPAAQAVAEGRCERGIVPCAATYCPPNSPAATTTPTCWPWAPAQWVP